VRGRGLTRGRRVLAGVDLPDQPVDGRERDGTAGREQADVADFLQALGQAMREKPAEKLHNVEVGGTEAGAAHVPGGAGARAVRECDKTAVGDGDLKNIRGEVGEGGVAVVVGLTRTIPGDRSDLGGEVFQQTGVAPLSFAERTIARGERFDGDKDVGAGGPPRRAVLGEAPTRDDGVHVGVVLALPTPGMEDARAPWEIGADDTCVGGEPCAGERRGVEQGLVRGALARADAGAERLRDGAGEEDVRSRQLLVQVVLEPLVGLMLLALGTVAVAPGMVHAVLASPGGALREAVAVVSALAVLDGTEALAVDAGQVGVARQVCGREGGEEIAQGGQGSRPCLRALRRSEASSWPWWVRWRESMVVARWVCPRERGMRRGVTPASSRWGAYAWRRVGMATPMLVSPARCVAVRKAPWTRLRRMGAGAVGLWW
jgi:hypothetical protein